MPCSRIALKSLKLRMAERLLPKSLTFDQSRFMDCLRVSHQLSACRTNALHNIRLCFRWQACERSAVNCDLEYSNSHTLGNCHNSLTADH